MRNTVFLVFLFSGFIFGQDDSRPWERLGLSLTEWKLIKDNDMPMSKVESLLKDGIGISEYFRKPWEPIGMTESKWIAKRRSGLTNYDIEQEARYAQNDSLMMAPSIEGSTFEEYDPSRETRDVFTGFFLPGVVQCRRGDKGRGRVMITLAFGAIGGTVAWSIVRQQFMPLPMVAIGVPDMIWSLVDHKIHVRNRRR